MIDTNVDSSAGLVTHVATGDVSVDEIEVAFEAALGNQSFRPGMSVLWNMCDATVSSMSKADVERLVRFNMKYKEKRGGGRSAIVVSRNVDFGIARMFQLHGDELPWQTRVFTLPEAAIRWLTASRGEGMLWEDLE
jgi:hypothetical protein